jgi:hypothetical protein
MKVDQDAVRTLRSLVHSIQVSLTGLDQRIKRELEVIDVVQSLAERARDLLKDIVKSPESNGPRNE